MLGTDGTWTSLARARFTADSNPDLRIDAGPSDDRFFLATGGDTKNDGTKLKETIELTATAERKRPEGLPVAEEASLPPRSGGS